VLTGPIRAAALGVFAAWHLGVMATMYLGLFHWICLAGLTVFVPGWLWDRLRRRKPPDPPTLYYDGECGFCERTVLLIRELLILPEVQIWPAQLRPSIDREMKERGSWVATDGKGGRRVRFDAFIELVRRSPIFGPIAHLLAWKPAADLGAEAYTFIARRRGAFGSATRWLRRRPLRHRLTPAGNAVVLAVLFYVFAWNVEPLFPQPYGVPPSLRWIGQVLRIQQHWNMFSPSPPTDDGWFVAPGRLLDGGHADALTGRPVSWDKPEHVVDTFKNQRWRKHMERLWHSQWAALREPFAKYTCRRWNDGRRDPGRLEKFRLYYVQEKTLPDGEAPPVAHLLRTHDCFKNVSEEARADPLEPPEALRKAP